MRSLIYSQTNHLWFVPLSGRLEAGLVSVVAELVDAIKGEVDWKKQ